MTDTFNLNEWHPNLQRAWLPDNNARAERQQKLPIQVIVGNPPWSAGQKSATDDNPNVDYPALEKRVEETYAVRSATTLKRHLYDTYKMAIRWASDRIEGQGVIAFVTNGAWIDGSVDAGIRACLAEEFSTAYILNLRGSTRASRSQVRLEGGLVFGQSTRSRVTVMILVKNPNAIRDSCLIHYRDIGDSLSREDKLEALCKAGSVSGFSDWQTITPNEHHDWIGQRSSTFAQFYPMGSKEAKAGTVDNAIFRLYSLGLATNRDAYIYNFSRDVCAENARKMVEDYLASISDIEDDPELTPDEVARRYAKHIKWSGNLKDNLNRRKKTLYHDSYLRQVAYRPFIPTNCYADYTFIQRKYQMDRIFPDNSIENYTICVSGIGSRKAFAVLITNTMTDLNLHEAGAQCFPRYRYPKPVNTLDATETPELGIDPESDRIDNISDTALRAFRDHYRSDMITKNAIFNYVYGILHSPIYRETFANDLLKEIPRIPFAPGFHAFAEAGKALATLHLGYETCEQYPLEMIFVHDGEPQPYHYQLTEKAMRLVDDGVTLVINEHMRLSGIPDEAHRYVVNDRTPLEWFIDRYRIKRDKASGILNDPNGWFENPCDLVTAIRRIVHVSVESTRIIEGLPSPLMDDMEG